MDKGNKDKQNFFEKIKNEVKERANIDHLETNEDIPKEIENEQPQKDVRPVSLLSPADEDMVNKAEEIVKMFRGTDRLNDLKEPKKEVPKTEGKLVTSDAPIETDFLDAVSDMICLPPEQKVFVNDSIYKTIDGININDNVLSQDGIFHKVTKVYKRKYKGNLIKIYPHFSLPISFTPNHPILIANINRTKQKTLWRKNFIEPSLSWKKAEEIKDTDFLVFPLPKLLKDTKEINVKHIGKWYGRDITIKANFKLDDITLRVIGFYISEGCTYKKRNKGNSYTHMTIFSFGSHEKEYINFVVDWLKNNSPTKVQIRDRGSAIQISSNDLLIYKFFERFGHTALEKILPMEFISLPPKKLLYILKGYIEGDGCIRKDIQISTVSEKLVYCLRLCMYKLGLIHAIYTQKGGTHFIQGRNVNCHRSYKLAIMGDSFRKIMDEMEGIKIKRPKITTGSLGYVSEYIYTPIRKIVEESYEGYVHNIAVDSSETYCTLSNIVHNCTQIHFTNSYRQSGDVRYLELSKAIREIRGKAQMRLVEAISFENWCSNKHILFSYRSLTEVADKLVSMDKIDLAKEISEYSKQLLELFVLLQRMEKGKNPKCIINW